MSIASRDLLTGEITDPEILCDPLSWRREREKKTSVRIWPFLLHSTTSRCVRQAGEVTAISPLHTYIGGSYYPKFIFLWRT